MKTILHKGIEVTYDEHCVNSYRWQKQMNSGNAQRSSRALSRLFCGRDEYYAYAISTKEPMSYEEWAALDDDALDLLDSGADTMGVMTDLFAAITKDAEQAAKN